MQNTPNLIQSLPPTGITCLQGHPNCAQISYPSLENDLFWQNRSFHIDVGTFGSGLLNQQHLVTLNPTLNQAVMGSCVNGAIYWDIGVRGDKLTNGTAGHESGFKLHPINSILDQAADYGPFSGTGNTHNLGSNPQVVTQYCNGSRVPPENGGLGYNVPPGISDATLPNPVFNLTPSATVDEGNNWINIAYGPLTLTNLTGAALGNYAITAASPAINAATAGNPTNGFAPNHDFFGNPRPQGSGFDIGAVEFVGSAAPPAVSLTAATTAAFPNVTLPVTAASAPTLDFRLSNAGPGTFTISSITVGAAPFSRINAGTFPPGVPNCAATLASGATCTIRGRFLPTTAGSFSGSVTVLGTGPGGIADTVTGSPLAISGTAASAPLPAVTIAALTTTTFPNVTLPVTAGSAPTLDFRLSNAGPGTFSITNVTVGAVPFSRTAAGTFPAGALNCGANVASGATCTIRVRFQPATTGTFNGSVSVTGNGPAAISDPVTASPLAISGTAGQGAVTFSLGTHTNGVTFTGGIGNGALAFGTQTVGSTASATLVLTNTGTAPFVFQIGDTVGGARFAKGTDLCTGGTLAVSATCSIVVTFNPNDTSARTGNLTVRDTAAASPQTVSLTGN